LVGVWIFSLTVELQLLPHCDHKPKKLRSCKNSSRVLEILWYLSSDLISFKVLAGWVTTLTSPCAVYSQSTRCLDISIYKLLVVQELHSALHSDRYDRKPHGKSNCKRNQSHELA
jgi:hypothetical protein